MLAFSLGITEGERFHREERHMTYLGFGFSGESGVGAGLGGVVRLV